MTEPASTGRRRRPFALGGGLFALAIAITFGALGAMKRADAPKPGKVADLVARTLDAQGIEAAAAQYRSLRDQGFPGLRESESDTNSLGYKLLGRDANESAIRVFQLNAETHPASANVHDSLGEAYLAAGDWVHAIESYRKALAIDPKLKTALAEVRRLTGEKRPPYPPLVLLHICAGMLGILSGAAAMALRKGSRGHAMAGRVFALSMLAMSGLAAYLAFVAPDGERINVLMGVFTFYLVATGWMAVRRKGGPGPWDWAGMLVAAAVGVQLVRMGLSGGRFAGVALLFGAVALLASGLDLRMVLRGGATGAGRIVRHLWRMGVALYIAVTSFFLGQSQVFPYALRKTGLLSVPSLLVGLALAFWLVRAFFAKVRRKAAAPRPGDALRAEAV